MAEPRAIATGQGAFLLPAGSRAVAAQRLRPLPAAAPPLLGVALIEGQAVPVLGLGDGAEAKLIGAWALLPSGLVVAGSALLDAAPEGAAPLPALQPAAQPLPPARPAAGEGGWVVAARRAEAAMGILACRLGPQVEIGLPFALVRRVLPLPPLVPVPGRPAGMAGLAVVERLAVLVVDPAALGGDPAPLLVVLELAGRRIGLPCQSVVPAAHGQPADTGALAALLEGVAAPEATPAPPTPPAPGRSLLLVQAGGQRFALAAEEVAAVLAPTLTLPAPGGRLRIVGHRGEVLPVADAGLALGGTAALRPDMPGPLLRLALPAPVALAVQEVIGLRRVPLAAITLVGPGLLAAVAGLPDGPLPVCRAAALAGGR
jgi:chemotaxis signal transduction protein